MSELYIDGLDGPSLDIEDALPDEYDDSGDDASGLDDCAQMSDGYCGMAGSEYCEFECPNRR